MVTKDNQAKKPKAAKHKKKLDIAAMAIIDNMVFNKSDVWAYYKVTNRAFDFLASEGKMALIQQLTNSLNTLMQDRQDSLDGHILCTSVPVDIDLWREQVYTMSKTWNRGPGFERYMVEMVEFLRAAAYHQKVVYIAINIGKRGALNVDGLNVFESGIKGAYDVGKDWLSRALMIPTEDIDEAEENEFRRKEENFHRNLSLGHLAATRCSAEELLLVIKRSLYPAMPAPYLDVDHGSRLGAGDLDLECSSAIENKYRWLRITQIVDGEEMDGYRATLSMSKFPKNMEFPGNWPFFYYLQKIGLPFTTYSRFSLHPSKKMKAELEKKRKEQRDELENLSGGMDSYDQAISGTPAHVSEALADSQILSEMLEMDKTAWVEGSYFIAVEAPTEELLRKSVSYLKQYFADIEINLNWTAGDQASLFLAQMPGDHHRMKSFDQITNLAMIPSSGFNFSSEVGDPLIGNENEVIV